MSSLTRIGARLKKFANLQRSRIERVRREPTCASEVGVTHRDGTMAKVRWEADIVGGPRHSPGEKGKGEGEPRRGICGDARLDIGSLL